MGIEPMTSSLPRKRSTPELHRLLRSHPGDIAPHPTSGLERETRLELATYSLEGYRSTN